MLLQALAINCALSHNSSQCHLLALGGLVEMYYPPNGKAAEGHWVSAAPCALLAIIFVASRIKSYIIWVSRTMLSYGSNANPANAAEAQLPQEPLNIESVAV
jgi:hypothetical protein